MVTAMLLAGVFAGMLFVALIVGDWVQFTSLTAPAIDYGLTVARTRDRVLVGTLEEVTARFGRDGVLRLPHGIARLFPEERRIVVRPQYQLFSLRFRTAWPLKGSVELRPQDGTTELTCRKRMPWSSALLTAVWFGIVALGTLAFVVSFVSSGGVASLGGLLMGLGLTGLGVLVMGFGVLVVIMAYRLEDHRLTAVYQELLRALEKTR
jgi:hypothetical protein